MSGKRKPHVKLLLTHQAITDLREIEAYSIARWRRRMATRYIRDIESALRLIRQDPSILQPVKGLPAAVQSYRVNKHLCICDVAAQSVALLTVIHASMDIPARLAELVPQLDAEVTMLRDQLGSGR